MALDKKILSFLFKRSNITGNSGEIIIFNWRKIIATKSLILLDKVQGANFERAFLNRVKFLVSLI